MAGSGAGQGAGAAGAPDELGVDLDASSWLGTNDHRWTVDSIRRIVPDTIHVFGPSRCMLASNFPVDGLYSSLGRLYAAFDEITADLDRPSLLPHHPAVKESPMSAVVVPVVVTAVFHPVEGRTAELVDALRATIPAVHEEEGCRLYAIHDAEDGTVTMIEKWDSREALAAHAAGPAVKALQAAVTGLLAGPATVTTMTPLPAGTVGQGEL